MTINCSGKLLDLETPKIMGILNCTTDSFFDGGQYLDKNAIASQIDIMILEGVDIIDIGGQSTRPNARLLSAEEEWSNIHFALTYMFQNYSEIPISVDSFYAVIHQKADAYGAAIINDISAGSIDSMMFNTVASLQKPYVLMHMIGTPQTMQSFTEYENLIVDMNYFFSEKISSLHELGVNDILLDPGFGFAKNQEQNFNILRYLDLIGFGDFPLLVGVSRKSMIYKTLNITPQEALNSTSALHMYALEKGAKILRVHDVKEAKQCITLLKLIKNS